ncbi:MAG TPA: Gfo/Idh/MocA family oxidoreductase [Gemmataceae bacterium]|nr:Gfo/Idh/MocA family oxidoreductase [Gemmataceae bacterium]
MTLSTAFYGAGERAQPYLRALARRADVRVTGVCDPDRRAAEAVAAGWGAGVFPSPEALLREARPDALWVCVPPHALGEVLLRAAEQGVPFFVEPPGAADYAGARLVGKRVSQADLVTAVGFATRYTDVLAEAREYLGAKALPLALGWWLRPTTEEEGPTTAAGLLWAEAAGLVDALRYFCGDVARVHALSAGAAGGGLVVQLELASGGVGVLTCTAYPRPDPRAELELLGEGWTLGFAAPTEGAAPALATLRLVERDRTTILRRLNDPAADHAAAFLEAVAARKPAAVPTGYAESLRTLAVCHAAAVSAREGRPVTVAEVEHLPTPPQG